MKKIELDKEEEQQIGKQLVCLADGVRGSEGTIHLSATHFMYLGLEAVEDGGEYEVSCPDFVEAVDMLIQPERAERETKGKKSKKDHKAEDETK